MSRLSEFIFISNSPRRAVKRFQRHRFSFSFLVLLFAQKRPLFLAHLITQNTCRLIEDVSLISTSDYTKHISIIRNASFFSTFDCLEMLHFLAHFLYQNEADHFGSFWSKMEHFWSEMVNISLSLSLSLSKIFEIHSLSEKPYLFCGKSDPNATSVSLLRGCV